MTNFDLKIKHLEIHYSCQAVKAVYIVKFGPFCFGLIPETLKPSPCHKEIIVGELNLVHKFKKFWLLFVLESRVYRMYRQHLLVLIFDSWAQNTWIGICFICSYSVFSERYLVSSYHHHHHHYQASPRGIQVLMIPLSF